MDPGTTPPPSTKSNSSMPLAHRSRSEPLTSRSRVAVTTLPPSANDALPAWRRAAPLAADGLAVATSSTSVFHSPHTSQRPAHLGCSAPHSVQR